MFSCIPTSCMVLNKQDVGMEMLDGDDRDRAEMLPVQDVQNSMKLNIEDDATI